MLREESVRHSELSILGGRGQNRTGHQGFAGPCITTLLPGQEMGSTQILLDLGSILKLSFEFPQSKNPVNFHESAK